MSDDQKPNPVDDLKKGLGLLFRAAKTAVDSLPTGKLEDVVMSGAREVGRAVENVAGTIDKELFHKEKPAAETTAPAPAEAKTEGTAKDGATSDEKKPDATANATDDAPKGPRIG